MGQDFAYLSFRRNRGWPWPEENYGLTPMFGEDGWCRSCGVPLRAQCGSLVLQRKGLSRTDGAWVPNWQFDVICLDEALAREVEDGFRVDLRPVEWHGAARGGVQQIVVSSTAQPWFDPATLTSLATASHGSAGAKCADCGTWRWMPLLMDELPQPKRDASWEDQDVLASPEWFGAGWKAFRQILLRRELAELLVRASPRDFDLHEFT